MVRKSPQTERLVETIEMLAEAGSTGRSLAEVSRHLDINKATIYPMINELVRLGWLSRHPKTKLLQLGPRLGLIGRSAEEGFDIVGLVRPRALTLAQSMNATCMLMASRENGIMVDSIFSGSAQARTRNAESGAMGLRPGDSIPFRPPLAAVFVAWSQDDVRDSWLNSEYWTKSALSDADKHDLLRSLSLIRRSGFAVHEFHHGPDTLGDVLSAATGNVRASQRARILLEGGFDTDAHDTSGGPRLLPEISLDAEYYPNSISAPIFDSEGAVTHALLITDLQFPLTGRQVIATGQKIVETANLIASDSGQPRSD